MKVKKFNLLNLVQKADIYLLRASMFFSGATQTDETDCEPRLYSFLALWDPEWLASSYVIELKSRWTSRHEWTPRLKRSLQKASWFTACILKKHDTSCVCVPVCLCGCMCVSVWMCVYVWAWVCEGLCVHVWVSNNVTSSSSSSSSSSLSDLGCCARERKML